MQYQVKLTLILDAMGVVEAEDADEAEQKARDRYWEEWIPQVYGHCVDVEDILELKKEPTNKKAKRK